MDFLLDTHTLLWYTTDDARLPGDLFGKIEDPGNRIHLSHVSFWEIRIKNAIGKLALKVDLRSFIRQEIEPYGFILHSIRLEDIIEATSLPLHYRDPFDRLLIAQSKVEKLPIISSDSVFDLYGIERVW